MLYTVVIQIHINVKRWFIPWRRENKW